METTSKIRKQWPKNGNNLQNMETTSKIWKQCNVQNMKTTFKLGNNPEQNMFGNENKIPNWENYITIMISSLIMQGNNSILFWQQIFKMGLLRVNSPSGNIPFRHYIAKLDISHRFVNTYFCLLHPKTSTDFSAFISAHVCVKNQSNFGFPSKAASSCTGFLEEFLLPSGLKSHLMINQNIKRKV